MTHFDVFLLKLSERLDIFFGKWPFNMECKFQTTMTTSKGIPTIQIVMEFQRIGSKKRRVVAGFVAFSANHHSNMSGNAPLF